MFSSGLNAELTPPRSHRDTGEEVSPRSAHRRAGSDGPLGPPPAGLLAGGRRLSGGRTGGSKPGANMLHSDAEPVAAGSTADVHGAPSWCSRAQLGSVFRSVCNGGGGRASGGGGGGVASSVMAPLLGGSSAPPAARHGAPVSIPGATTGVQAGCGHEGGGGGGGGAGSFALFGGAAGRAGHVASGAGVGGASGLIAPPRMRSALSRSSAMRSSGERLGGRLSPLLERPLTPPPDRPWMIPLRAIGHAAAEAYGVVSDCTLNLCRCSCYCFGACALLAALLLFALFIFDRQPSPCRSRGRAEASVRAERGVGAAYNQSEGSINARLAAASYCGRSVVEGWRCGACAPESGLTNVSYFHSELTQAAGYVGLRRDARGPQAVVVFRGTAAYRNWLADAVWGHRLQHEWGEGAVHFGFLKVYQSVQARVRQLLLQMRADALARGPAVLQLRVRLVGHSLGGALATIAAADMIKATRFRVDELWTFGSPRVGDERFVRWLWEETLAAADVRAWRVTHSHDPVVHLPLRSMGFVHVPTEVWYPDKRVPARCKQPYEVCDDGPAREDPACAARVWFGTCLHRSNDHLLYATESFDHTLTCAEPTLEKPSPPPFASRAYAPPPPVPPMTGRRRG